MRQPSLLVERTETGSALTLTFMGRLYIETLATAFKPLESYAFKPGMELRLDLSGVDFLDSSAIGSIIRWHRRLQEEQVELRLLNVHGEVLRTLKLCNLSNLIDIQPRSTNPGEQGQRQRELLWKSHHYAEQVLAALGEGLIGLNADCRILYMNPATEKMLGIAEEDALGLRLCQAGSFRIKSCTGLKDNNCAIVRMLNNGDQVYRDEIFITSGDARIPVGITMRAIFESNAEGNEELVGAVLGINDVSDRHRAQASEREFARLEATTTLAAGIAHDFNNLIVGVLGNAEMLKMDLADNPQACAMLEEISSVGRRAADLSQQMLAYARGGRRETVEIDLPAIIRDVLKSLQAISSPTVSFQLQYPQDIWMIRGDTNQVRQIVKNVLMNAVEAVNESGQISVTLHNIESWKDVPGQNQQRPGHAVCLSVHDNGCGMDAPTRERIFEPFFSTKSMGRGLGLAAVYGIVRNHGGVLNVSSQPGDGSNFDIYLPSTGKAPSRPGEVEKSERKQSVLIVDDEDLVLRISQVILERQGYEVLTARDGKTAMEIAKTHSGPIDVALVDIGMPDIDGRKLFRPLRDARPKLKIIACSGMALDGNHGEMAEDGMVDFLPKPFDPGTLTRTLAKALAM